MTLKQLEYFLEIAKMESVTKAAQNLNISQPPLSLQLKALEEELGVSLFNRDKRNLEITPEGRLLQERAEAILALLDETTRNIQTFSKDKRATIRIGTIGSVNNRLLPEKIAQFSQEFPHVNFRVLEARTDTILNSLNQGRIDIGFAREPFNMTSFRSVSIRDPALKPNETDYFAAIAQPQLYTAPGDGPLPLEDLQGKPLITHRRYREMLVSACRKKGFSPNIICENDEIFSSFSWARAGIAIAIAPYTSAIQNEDSGLVIRRLESLNFSPQVRLVWLRAAKLSPEAIAFINMM